MEGQNEIESIIPINPDYDTLRATWREVGDTAGDIGHFIENQLIEKDMPGIRIKKIDLGNPLSRVSVNPDEEIEIRPLKRMGRKRWRRLEWSIRKLGEERVKPPLVTAHPISAAELKNALELTRNYRGITKDETALLFRNERGEKVGWVAYSEPIRGHCYLGFIGAVDKTKGYGSSMLQYLKDRFQRINLSVIPYHTEDLAERMSFEENAFRTQRFYVRNGFVGNGGSYGWDEETPNIEDMKTGEKRTVKYRFDANGTTFWTNNLMEIYLKKFRESGISGKFVDQKTERAIDAWLKLKEEYHRLSLELDKLA